MLKQTLLILSPLLFACAAQSPTAPPLPQELRNPELSPAQERALAKASDFGCPIVIGLGAKGYELPHPGQWFRASYPMGICALNEWATEWEITPQPKVMDICRNSTSLADKLCGDKVGKFLWIGTPGTYNVTARARDAEGVVIGEATLFEVLVD